MLNGFQNNDGNSYNQVLNHLEQWDDNNPAQVQCAWYISFQTPEKSDFRRFLDEQNHFPHILILQDIGIVAHFLSTSARWLCPKKYESVILQIIGIIFFRKPQVKQFSCCLGRVLSSYLHLTSITYSYFICYTIKLNSSTHSIQEMTKINIG